MRPRYGNDHAPSRQRLTFVASCVLTLILAGFAVWKWALRDYPDGVASAVRQKSESMQVTTQIVDLKGRNLGVFSDETRFIVPYDQIPKRVRLAFVAAEDDGFFSHWGISPGSMVRAAVANFRRDRFAQGGSTITQQLVRQFLLPRDKTMGRKIREIIMALSLEREMSKDQILEVWLNSVYLGNNSWGVEAAARHYFGKSVSKLSIAEASILAGLPQAPSRYAPHIRPNAARSRQLYVLDRMRRLRWLTEADYKKSRSENVSIKKNRVEVVDRAPWVTESVRLELWRRLEQKNLPKTGLLVNTTIDRDWQLNLQSLISQSFSRIREKGMEVAVVVLDTKSGDIRAQVGGSDFRKNQFNRALDLYRPIGASIYPWVFAWAVEKGIVKVDGYSSIAEAAVKSRFAEAEQLAPEIGYGLVRDKLLGLGFVVRDAMAIDEMFGSPLNLARAFLGIGGASHVVPRGVISNVVASGRSIYSADEVSPKYSSRVDPAVAWVIRKWMSMGAAQETADLAGQPILKSIKGWNSWWIIVRTDAVIAAWVGADIREPTSPSALKDADKAMDILIGRWIRQNLKSNDGMGSTPDGISYVIQQDPAGRQVLRIPFVSSERVVF